MSKSLQDQLLKAGVIDGKKAKKIAKDKRQQRKQKIDDSHIIGEEAKKIQLEKQARDRDLNLKRQAEADKKALTAQVIQLTEHYQLKNTKGELEYNFTDDKTIKKIRVNSETLEQLTRGRLSIAKLREGYALIPTPIADKISSRDPAAIIVSLTKTDQSQTQNDDDDYYAQFEIPDDLSW